MYVILFLFILMIAKSNNAFNVLNLVY